MTEIYTRAYFVQMEEEWNVSFLGMIADSNEKERDRESG